MAMCIIVRKQSSLKHLIRTWFNSWHQMSWAKSQLFDFGKIISRISVENQFSSGDQGKFFMRPNFGQIKWVEFPIFSFLKSHHLNIHSVGWIISLGNSIVHISDSKIGFILSIHHFECVRSITVHVTVSIRGTSVRKQKRNLVSRFLSQSNEIPKHIRIFQMGGGISFLSVNKIREH